MREVRDRQQTLPEDRCPHVSGGQAGFRGCPAFRAVIEQPEHPVLPGLDFLTHEPSPLLTCSHLLVGSADDGRFYGRCRLGPAAARWAYANLRPRPSRVTAATLDRGAI